MGAANSSLSASSRSQVWRTVMFCAPRFSKRPGARVPLVVVVLAAGGGNDHDGSLRPAREADEAFEDRVVAERPADDDQRALLGALLGGSGAGQEQGEGEARQNRLRDRGTHAVILLADRWSGPLSGLAVMTAEEVRFPTLSRHAERRGRDRRAHRPREEFAGAGADRHRSGPAEGREGPRHHRGPRSSRISNTRA